MPARIGDIHITPIDLQAPKGRLILPQVQAIRDSLDNDLIVMVVKEREYPDALRMLNKKPDLVVCDSQVVYKMVARYSRRRSLHYLLNTFLSIKGRLCRGSAGSRDRQHRRRR